MSNITFYKKTKTEIDEIDIEEGNILFDTTNKEILVDDDGVRESYGGAGGTNIVDLTRAEYNLLPESKKTDGKMYCITDEDVYVSANTVSLNIDGQTSNVQSGFDEISSNVDTINQNLTEIKEEVEDRELYDKYENITLPFTAPKTGEFWFEAGTATAGNWYLSLKNTTKTGQEKSFQFSGNSTYAVTQSFMLKKGDTISFLGKGGGIGSPKYYFR